MKLTPSVPGTQLSSQHSLPPRTLYGTPFPASLTCCLQLRRGADKKWEALYAGMQGEGEGAVKATIAPAPRVPAKGSPLFKPQGCQKLGFPMQESEDDGEGVDEEGGWRNSSHGAGLGPSAKRARVRSSRDRGGEGSGEGRGGGSGRGGGGGRGEGSREGRRGGEGGASPRSSMNRQGAGQLAGASPDGQGSPGAGQLVPPGNLEVTGARRR